MCRKRLTPRGSCDVPVNGLCQSAGLAGPVQPTAEPIAAATSGPPARTDSASPSADDAKQRLLQRLQAIQQRRTEGHGEQSVASTQPTAARAGQPAEPATMGMHTEQSSAAARAAQQWQHDPRTYTSALAARGTTAGELREGTFEDIGTSQQLQWFAAKPCMQHLQGSPASSHVCPLVAACVASLALCVRQRLDVPPQCHCCLTRTAPLPSVALCVTCMRARTRAPRLIKVHTRKAQDAPRGPAGLSAQSRSPWCMRPPAPPSLCTPCARTTLPPSRQPAT